MASTIFGRECWVTYALTEDDAVGALVLAKSLRRHLTTRPLILLAHHGLSAALWDTLQTDFDAVNRLRENVNPKVAALSLTKWSKIAFVHPHSMAVKNCDDIFKLRPVSAKLANDYDVFVAKPFLRFGQQTGNIDKVFGSLEIINKLPEKYAVDVDLQNSMLAGTKHDFDLVQFYGSRPIEFLTGKKLPIGTLEQRLLNLWKNHFGRGVAQSLLSIQNELSIPIAILEEFKEQPIDFPSDKILDDCKNAVAIIGISCRFPGANSLAEFWELLIQGKDAISASPEGRWTLDHCPRIPEESKDSRAGFMHINLEDFDGKFFGMSPMELSYMDPQQRITLQLAWEALEDAGINPASLKGSYTGVYGGAWRSDYREELQEAGTTESEFFRSYLGNSLGVLTARVSHCLGLTGPAVSTESGCSSSIVAVDLACKSLVMGETDLSLACGVNLLIHPFTGKSMSTVLAPDSHCKTFDASADGFARAEACSVLVLKRYPDAVRDGDRIHGLIRGSAVVQEGASRSLGTPTKVCEALAMSKALESARVEAEAVSYVETHGTGTPVGDPLEVAAVAQVYSGKRTLTIGSVKTNIGHTESVSGIAGIVKVVLSFQNEIIPPHINFKTLNPDIDLECIPAQIPLEAMEWKAGEQPRLAGVSSFGITGTDAHAIVQDTPRADILPPTLFQKPDAEHPPPYFILTLAGRSEEALNEIIRSWREFIFRNDKIPLGDITHTANVGRAHFPHRAAFVAPDRTAMLERLGASPNIAVAPEEPPKICFLFTGQGSQYAGMARSIYEHSLTFKLYFDKCAKILQDSYNINLKSVLWGDQRSELGRSLYSQTSIFVIEYCMLKLWESWGVTPSCVVGHSLGEFAAAVAAGTFQFEDAIKLVAERSRLIDSLPNGKMLVLKECGTRVEALLKKAFEKTDGWLDFAAINSPEQTVVAGDENNVKYFAEFCKNNKIKCTVLDASHAFHSRHMDPILNEYKEFASNINYNSPSVSFISGMEGTEVSEINADYWVKHTRDMVRFQNAIRSVMESGCSHFLELGPQPVLSALTMINSDGIEELETSPVCLPSLRKHDEDWKTILTTVGKLYTAGFNLNWTEISEGNVVTAPFYVFQPKAHWFVLPDRGPPQIHPLVGKALPNASSHKIFNNRLEIESLEYLQDHCIGSKIIFPGAGFLEICLVAGHSATSCTELTYFQPTAPVTIENFSIESPLGLSSSESTDIQVIVTNEDSGETKITVYSKLSLDKETQKWIKHASATFNPYITSLSTPEENVVEQLQSRCSEPVKVSDTYQKLSEFGMKFGPTFRTLQSVAKTEDGEFLFEVSVTASGDKYVSHPAITDALFQALMAATTPDANKLFVPVSVRKFTVFNKLTTSNCYIHCKKSEANGEEFVATLYDAESLIIAQMQGAILVETTVGAIMAALEAQKLLLPNMFEDVWRVSPAGPLDRRVDLMKALNPAIFDAEQRNQIMDKYLTLTSEEEIFTEKSDRLYALYMMNALYNLEQQPEVGQIYVLNEVRSSAKVLPSLEEFLRFLYKELTKEGHFEIVDSNYESMSFKCIQPLPPKSELIAEMEKLYQESHAISPHEVDFVSSTGRNLADFLTGKQNALPVLFPEDPSQVSAEAYYMEAMFCRAAHAIARDILGLLFEHTPALIEQTKGIIRILEVGAGTGSFTKTTVPFLEPFAQGVEFTYTDLSAAFFNSGDKVFQNSKVSVIYRILNIEDDGVAQGFLPAHYDIIIANNVIHATKDVRRSTRNLRNLLREDGILMVAESITPVRGTLLTFGMLDAYWHCTDKEYRGYTTELSGEQWVNTLLDVGFRETTLYTCFKERLGLITGRAGSDVPYVPAPLKVQKGWVLFGKDDHVTNYLKLALQTFGFAVVVVRRGSKFERLGEAAFVVNPMVEEDFVELYQGVKKERSHVDGTLYLWGLGQNSENGFEEVAAYLNVCKALVAMDKPKLFAITKGVQSVGDHDVSLPHTAPIIGLTKSFQNEQPNATARHIDLQDGSDTTNIQLDELIKEILLDDGEIHVAYRDHHRNVPRCISWKPQSNALAFPKSERFHLCLPPTKAIRDLRFGPVSIPSEPLGPTKLEVKIKSYALNFRDVFVVLKPSSDFDNLDTVGLDWSGEVVDVGSEVTKYKVGDPVFSINMTGDSLPSHLRVEESIVVPVPPSMTHNEAATIPAVGATAYLCLVKVAKLTKDDTILIHTGSGGVGIVAIQVAKSIGARIVSTAGSKRKRAYLRTLGVEHVFHSRNTSYEQGIRTTVGSVDVVLNSLTSEGFKEASLSVLRQGGRFVEMSKLNTWTKEEVKQLRPDVDYTVVDLSSSGEEDLKDHLKGISEYLEKNIIRPVPYCRFDASEIREALTYLQKAKHVGKIVVRMPESDGKIPLFSKRSTYVVTGGLGGIGMEVAKWMTSSGAKHVALVGRNPPNDKAEEEIRRMNSKGANVFALQCDVGVFEQCKEMMESLGKMGIPKVRGVMHAAGVISDAILSNQSWEKYMKTYNPKVCGGWNLHKLTLDCSLEHFVMFSSAVASFGSLGQSNHASANYFLDSLAKYRHSIGLPATTINWGQWGQVGVAANIELAGLRPFTALQGISALERVLKSQRLQTCVCEADFGIVKEIFQGTRRYLEELRLSSNDVSKEFVINNEQFWNDYDNATDSTSKLEILKKFVRSMIRQILKLGAEETLNDEESFQDMGMDSLMMIEMKNVVQSSLGKRVNITVNSVKDCHNISQLATRLLHLLEGEEELPSPTREELCALMRQDSILPEDIQLAGRGPCLASQVRRVLVTGSTGNMGPYFLRSLSQLSSIEKIYCIVREDKGKSAEERLGSILKDKRLLDEVDMSKVTVIAGSVTQPKLGLNEDSHEMLSEEVDAIFHLAVRSSFTEEYKKIEREDASDIRTVNVKGTVEVLKFACEAKQKLLFHASSIVTNNSYNEDFTLSESWPGEADFDDMPNSAYAISKFVCDRMLAEAVQKLNFPVKVFRFPAVGGDSRTGANVDYANNQLMLRLLSYLHIGSMPALPVPFFILPVDVCVELSMDVFFRDETPYDMYNVYNPFPHNETDLVEVAEEIGCSLQVLEPEEFRERLDGIQDSQLVHFLKEASENRDAQNRWIKQLPAVGQAWLNNPRNAFTSRKLAALLPNYPDGVEDTLTVVKRDLKYAKESGVFEKLGLS